MTLDNKFDEELLDKIKTKHLLPTPRWHFLLKNYVVWGIGLLSLIIGGLAFSVIIYMFSYNDWNIYDKLSNSFTEFVILTLPYFWIVFLIFFIVIVNYNIKYTKQGYRYHASVVLAVSVILSMGLGVLFFGLGMGQEIDDILGERMPFYERIINRRIGDWNHPEAGRLTGIIASTSADKKFILYGFDKHEWEVNYTNAKLAPFAEIKVGLPVRLIGLQTKLYFFEAEQILPVGPGRRFLERDKESHIPPFPPRPENLDKIPDMRPGGLIPEKNDEMKIFFEKYPELKKSFSDNLLADKEKIKEILKRDPEFISRLKTLNIDQEIIKKLQE
jgi:hypothetical protein